MSGGRIARKQAIFPLFLNAVDHLVEMHIRQAVAVVGEEVLLVLDVVAHRRETLTDVAPDPGVDQRDAPILLDLGQELDVRALLGHDAVGEDLRLVVEEELLDDVRLVAEAQHEIAVAVLAVVVHHVPQDRLMADRDHGLRDVLGVLADAGAKAAAEQNNLH